jgi:hypothetical protein
MPTRTTPLVAPNLPPLTQAPTAQPVVRVSGAGTPRRWRAIPACSSGCNRLICWSRAERRAARGTLLSGGFQTELAKLNQGLASQEYGNLYDRALRTYDTNRETTGQNFGQSLASWRRSATSTETRAIAAMQQGGDTLNANSGADDAYARQMGGLQRGGPGAARRGGSGRDAARCRRRHGRPSAGLVWDEPVVDDRLSRPTYRNSRQMPRDSVR